MATLVNDAGSMRLTLRLVQRESQPAAPPSGGEGAPSGRFLATTSIDHYDRRDGSYWPFAALPALYVAAAAAEELVTGIRELLSGAVPGFSWRSDESGPLALQLGGAPGGQVLVEVGLDLGRWLAEISGTAPGGEACLFRFATTRAELVRFADAVGAEARSGGGA